MKKNIKKSFLFMVIALVLLSATACSGGSVSDGTGTSTPAESSSKDTTASSKEPSDDAVEIEFWNLFGGLDGTYITAMVDEYNALQSDYFINVTTQDFDTYYTKLKTSVVGGEAPDFCISHDDYVWGLIKSGILEPIEPLSEELNVNILFENYIEKLNMLRYDNTVYAVPLDGVIRILHYNKALCERAGLLSNDGKLLIEDGLDGWLKACENLDDTGINPLVTREKGSHPVYLFNTLYYQHGGTQPWISDDGSSVTIEKDICIDALNAYQKILSYNPEGVDNVGELFLTGEYAFCIDQSAAANTYYQSLGEDYGAQGLPQWGSKYATAVFSHTFVLPVNSKRTDEQTKGALEFIKWFGENNMGWAACGHMPANKVALESDAFKESKLHQLYSYSVDYPTNSLSYGAPIAMKGSNEINDPLYQVGRGEITPEEGYELIYNNLTNLLDEYN